MKESNNLNLNWETQKSKIKVYQTNYLNRKPLNDKDLLFLQIILLIQILKLFLSKFLTLLQFKKTLKNQLLHLYLMNLNKVKLSNSHPCFPNHLNFHNLLLKHQLLKFRSKSNKYHVLQLKNWLLNHKEKLLTKKSRMQTQ